MGIMTPPQPKGAMLKITLSTRLKVLVHGVIDRHWKKRPCKTDPPAKQGRAESLPVHQPATGHSHATLPGISPDEFFDRRRGEWWRRTRHDDRKWWNPAWNGYCCERKNEAHQGNQAFSAEDQSDPM